MTEQMFRREDFKVYLPRPAWLQFLARVFRPCKHHRWVNALAATEEDGEGWRCACIVMRCGRCGADPFDGVE